MNVSRILPIASQHRNPTDDERPRLATICHLSTPRTRALSWLGTLRRLAPATIEPVSAAITLNFAFGALLEVEKGDMGEDIEGEARRLFKRILRRAEKAMGSKIKLGTLDERPLAPVVDLAAYRASRAS